MQTIISTGLQDVVTALVGVLVAFLVAYIKQHFSAKKINTSNGTDHFAVQDEFERRSNMRGYSRTGKSAFTSEYAFSGKLFCQNCGSKFRRASWGTGKNKQYVWRCINREQNGVDKCSAKTVKEKGLEQAFLRVMNKTQKVSLTKFDEDIFRRLIEKVKVQSFHIHSTATE